MASIDDLKGLARELQGVSSPIGRLKILARGWRVLRGLGGRERRWLASQVGFEGAEELLTRMAGGKGRLGAPFLLKTLRKAKGANPLEIDRFIDVLKDPKRRKAKLRDKFDELEQQLLGEEPSATDHAGEPVVALPVSETEPIKLKQRRIRKTKRESKPVAAPAVAAATVAPVILERAKRTADQVVPLGELDRLQPQSVEAAPNEPVIQQPDEAVRVLPESKPPTSVAVKPEVPPTPVFPAAPPLDSKPPTPEPQAAPEATSLLEELGTAGRLMDKLRTLSESADEARQLDPAQLRGLLEQFPSGWPRRRALNGLLVKRIPEDLHKAVFLIESLESVISRRWCLNTILNRWALEEWERELLEERHKSISGRKSPVVAVRL